MTCIFCWLVASAHVTTFIFNLSYTSVWPRSCIDNVFLLSDHLLYKEIDRFKDFQGAVPTDTQNELPLEAVGH